MEAYFGGASKGLILGAVLGGTVATWYLREFGGAYPDLYFVGISVGIIGGGLFGAGVGAAFPAWEPIELR